MADTIFDDNFQETEIDLTLNDLVGEGRKYSDPDQLAKAYANVEAHARKLEKENADARAKIDTAEAKLKNQKPPEPSGQAPLEDDDTPNPKPNKEPTPGSVDFRSQIKEEIEALNKEDRAKANLDTAAAKLVELYGSQTKASEAIKERADELGVSVEWLKDSAGRSPAAFYASMGIQINSGTDRSTPTPRSDVRLDERNTGKSFEFFDRIRVDNPKLYFSAATQREMMNEARKQGSDFYKR